MSDLVFHCQLDEQDMVQFQSRQLKWFFIVFWIVWLFFIVSSLSTLFASGFSFHNLWDWFPIIFGIFFASLPIRTKIKFKKNLSQNRFKQFEQIYTISDNSILVEAKGVSGTSSNTITWDKFFKITEFEDVFYLYISKNCAFILPKRCLENIEQIMAIKMVFKDKIDRKKLKLLK